MAASLAKAMSQLSLHIHRLPQKLLPEVISTKAPAWSLTSIAALRKYSTILNCKQENPLSLGPKSGSNTLPGEVCSFHTTPIRTTTVELKQWREQRVINRFYRLHWGAWIRCRGGRKKSLYKKKSRDLWFVKQHIFCNAKQNKLLDTLTLPHWKEPKYFVESPYEPYHKRTNSFHFPNHRKFYP